MNKFIQWSTDLVDALEQENRHIRLPRRTMFFLHALIGAFELAAVLLAHGIWIIVSLFLCLPTAYVIYLACKVWKRYYAMVTIIPVLLFQFVLVLGSSWVIQRLFLLLTTEVYEVFFLPKNA